MNRKSHVFQGFSLAAVSQLLRFSVESVFKNGFITFQGEVNSEIVHLFVYCFALLLQDQKSILRMKAEIPNTP